MSLQPLFRRFHEVIKLKDMSDNAELRLKRDRVLRRLESNLTHSFECFNQGSYAMGTGIRPLNGDYDIDVGIVLEGVSSATHDPVEVKRWVYEAVKSHTTRVEWRRPCITVYYQQGGEPVYHVDLAVFVKERSGRRRLAIGREHSAPEQCEWQLDDREKFIKDVKNKHGKEDGAQFRRVIRYLKRWKDEHFPAAGHAAPTGLFLTVAAFHWFEPGKTLWWGKEDDLKATLSLVRSILDEFSGGLLRPGPRLRIKLPRAPHDDVCARMTDQQMRSLRKRLQELKGWLTEARGTGSSAPLVRAFGEDFPAQ